MRTIVLTALISSLFLFNACTRPGASNILVQADSLMQKHPDSALHFLQNIQPEELISQEDRAYYALLMTQARDKNFIFQTNDSLINIAVQYYESAENIPMQAKAHFYRGCIRRNNRDYTQALKDFHTAIAYANKSFNNKLAGYVYNNIANLYYLQKLNEQADSIYQITEKLAIEERDSSLWADALSQRGMINIRKGRKFYHEAEQILLRAFAISHQNSHKSMIAKVAYSLSLLYGRMNIGEKAVEFAKLNINNQSNPDALYRAQLVLGDAYYKVSKYDSALIFLSKSLCSEDEYTKAGAYMRLADIAKKQGQLEKALKLERKYSAYLDSAQQQQVATIINTAKDLNEYNHSEVQSVLGKSHYYMIAGIIALLLLFISLWRTHKKQVGFLQKELAIHNYSQQEKVNLQDEVHSLSSERQALLKEAFEHSEVYVKMKRIIQAYKKTDKSNEHFDEEDWRQLIAETDTRWNNITIRLVTKYPLSLDEIYLCCLYLTDFPTSHFRYIMECSRDAIYKKAKRIVEVKMKYPDKTASLRDILAGFL